MSPKSGGLEMSEEASPQVGDDSAPQRHVAEAQALAGAIRDRSGFSNDDAGHWRRTVEWLLLNPETRQTVEEAFELIDDPKYKTVRERLREGIPPQDLENSDKARKRLTPVMPGIPASERSEHLLTFLLSLKEVRALFEAKPEKKKERAGAKLKYPHEDLYALKVDYHSFLKNCKLTRHGIKKTKAEMMDEYLTSARTTFSWLPRKASTARKIIGQSEKVDLHDIGGTKVASTVEGLAVHRFRYYETLARRYSHSLLGTPAGDALDPRRTEDQTAAREKEPLVRKLAGDAIRTSLGGFFKLRALK
jgi:hypothetical protein